MKAALNTFGVCTLAMVACSGCSMWSKSTPKTKDSSWAISKLWKKEYQQPQSIAAIWAPDVLAMPGKPETRGFGGRIYFYNELSQAIPVDGDLMVHGYMKNTRRGHSDHITADKTFGFTAEQLTGHFSPSEMGASYSVWIPWDAADGLRQEITLIPTFKGKDGTVVQGSPAKVNLPGRIEEGGEKPSTLMQTVSYSSSSTPTNPGPVPPAEPAKMRTTTIHVPSNSTIAQPKRYEAFTLGGGETSAQPATSGMGVSTGGSASLLSSPAIAPQTNGKRSSTLPADTASGQTSLPLLKAPAGGFRTIDVKQLTPPPMADARAFPRAVPMQPATVPEWTSRGEGVRQASFNE